MMLLKVPGVYAPDDDTSMLLRALRNEPVTADERVLDIGTGTGVLACAAARRGARSVTAVDVSRRAVMTTRFNAWLAGLPVRAVHGDLAGPVQGQRFDLVLANPPYVPAPDSAPPRRGRARSWDAGHDGRAVLDRLCGAVKNLLGARGVLLLVHSELCGAHRTLRLLDAVELRAEVIDRREVPFGPVMRSRSEWLRTQGLIHGDELNERLVVIRAERRA
jgi:release factor glutamine methyltransferase